jgi:hypothetical protein
MLCPESDLLRKLVALLVVGQSCFAARIPAKALRVQDSVRRQQLVCQEQIVVAKVLIPVPVRRS